MAKKISSVTRHLRIQRDYNQQRRELEQSKVVSAVETEEVAVDLASVVERPACCDDIESLIATDEEMLEIALVLLQRAEDLGNLELIDQRQSLVDYIVGRLDGESEVHGFCC